MTHVFFDQDKIDWTPYLKQQQIGEGVMIKIYIFLFLITVVFLNKFIQFVMTDEERVKRGQWMSEHLTAE